jgi:hypothetical protein
MDFTEGRKLKLLPPSLDSNKIKGDTVTQLSGYLVTFWPVLASSDTHGRGRPCAMAVCSLCQNLFKPWTRMTCFKKLRRSDGLMRNITIDILTLR